MKHSIRSRNTARMLSLKTNDLYDEFVTLAEQKQFLKDDGNLNNPLSVAQRTSRGVRDIKKLDKIANNGQQFGQKHDSVAMQSNKRRLESCFYVNEVDIIGTECDLENIIGLYIGCQNWNLCQIGCLNSLPSYKFRFLIRAPFIRDWIEICQGITISIG